MMSGTRLVTAALSTFNAQETVLAALESVLAQNWPSLEVIVADDASTDDTVATVEAFIAHQRNNVPPVRLLRNPENVGVAATRNRLIAEARGDYVAFFDDDDVSRPDRITRQMERIRAVQDRVGHHRVICHTAREQVFPDGTVHYEPTMGTEGGPLPEGRAVAERILIGRLSPNVVGSCATCSQLAPRALYQELGGFDEGLRRSEDTDLAVRLALSGGVFCGIAAPLVRQRMTRGAEKRLAAEHEAYVRMLDKHAGFLAEQGWLGFSRAWRDIRLLHLGGRHGRVVAGLTALGLRHPVKLARKLRWSLPARRTRQRQQAWNQSDDGSMETGQ